MNVSFVLPNVAGSPIPFNKATHIRVAKDFFKVNANLTAKEASNKNKTKLGSRSERFYIGNNLTEKENEVCFLSGSS